MTSERALIARDGGPSRLLSAPAATPAVADVTTAPDVTVTDITGEDVRDALAAGAMRLAYQPQIEMATGRLRSVEALLRWDHPRFGVLSPAQFLSAITRDGLWSAVTGWVICRAVADAASWRAAGAAIPVWVNVAAADVSADTALVEQVRQALAEHGLPGELLGLELTESGVLRNLDEAVSVLESLREEGVGIALDDFGTGFSSLTHLRRLPFNSVKIDRSFVQRIDASPADAAITGAIIEVCRSLGVDSVVEGVERVAEWDVVARLGATQAQGFLLARPGPAAHAPRWLETSWSALVAERRREQMDDAPVARPATSGTDAPRARPAPAGIIPTPLRDPRFGIWADRLTSSLDSAVTIIDFDGRFGYVSPSVARLLGREPHALTATNYLDLIHPDDAADVQRAVRQLAGSEQPVQHAPLPVCRLRHADGSWVVAELAGSTEVHHAVVDGVVDGIVLVMARVSSEASPRARLRRLRQLDQRLSRAALGNAPQTMVESLGDAMRELAGVLGVDAAAIEGLIVPENRCLVLGSWDERTGVTVCRADAVETQLTDMPNWMAELESRQVVAVEDFPGVTDAPWVPEVGVLWLDQQAVQSLVAVPLRALGRVVAVLTLASRQTRQFDDDVVAALQAIGTTVTHGLVRLHAQQYQPPRDERITGLFADAEDLMCVMDGLGTIRHVTAASTRVLGRAPDELVGRSMIELLHPEDVAGAHRLLQRIRSVGRSTLIEVRVQHADGTWRWMETSARFAMRGDVDGVVVVVRDITARVAARERDARAQELEQLALQISQQALRAELVTSAETLDEFSRELARLLSIDLVFIDELEGSVMTSRGAYVPETSTTQVLAEYDLRDHPAIARQLERREPFFFDDCPVEPNLWASMESDPRDDHGGALLPLIANGRLVGSLALSSRARHEWTAAERTTLLLIADTLAAMFERRRLEEARDHIEGRFRVLADHAADVVTLSDEDGVLVYVSPASTDIIGLPPSELMGVRMSDIVHPDDQAAFAATFVELRAGSDVTFEFRLVRPDGSWLWVSNRSRRVNLDGGRIEYWGALRDISEHRRLELELLHRASHDPLTDLANRTVFSRALDALAEARDLPASLVVIDLDGFKAVNDTFGHPAGDRLLVEIAERMRNAVRETDVLARVGGDEFIVLCPRTGRRDASRLVDRLLRDLPKPTDLGDGRSVGVGCSVGVATAEQVRELDRLLHDADAAMYAAKSSGKRRVVYSEPDQPG